eukprot:CAMPEP_0201487404 /NCGR_PEP_ID=MMETSP0151_2-20130828/12849_1 /ASSEMBLY_ACC=CAM_ASM_000257 /TAXON_ID=200890 /ORGANISM="Paramoeba atlantica, Strain 621/1 / CCAP 1560/9" /LENGTH=140 /DNA_ID=CAMNT_0047872423 /DNA_START=61 /DNA_END=483 /DNA_ORIENTATION=+
MGSKGQEFLDKWNKLFQEKTKEEAKQELFHMIADDVVMGAPPYRKKLTGKMKVWTILGIIIDLVPDFKYDRQFVDGSDLALEFLGHVDSQDKFPVQGIDLIHVNDQGQIDRIDVMIRPLPSLVEIKRRVREIITPLLSKL